MITFFNVQIAVELIKGADPTAMTAKCDTASIMLVEIEDIEVMCRSILKKYL